MSFQEMTLEALWANEPDHDWMVGDCPDKKCSEWYKLHTQWLNEVNHRFRLFEAEVKTLKAKHHPSIEFVEKLYNHAGELEKRLAKARDAFNHFPDSDADFNEPHEGMSSVTRLYYGWAKVEKWKDKMEKALGGDE
jgi:hypothetical protein